jgi:DNA polymerase
MSAEKEKQLEELAESVKKLNTSPLFDYRQKNGYSSVFGEGDVNSRVMLIGEAPGEREAKTGRPFVGASGKFLDELLESAGIRRSNIYITNIVKDRPPGNRDPSPAEIETYAPFLLRQIEIIQPKAIATLGRFAMDFILKHFEVPEYGQKISDLHGKRLEGQGSYGKIAIIPLYHPAVALYNQSLRETLKEDLQILKPLTN